MEPEACSGEKLMAILYPACTKFTAGSAVEEIEALAKQSMVLPDYQGNPRVATYDEMVELVFEAYHQ